MGMFLVYEDFKEKTMRNLLRQKNGVPGNFRKYLINLYNYIDQKIKASDTDYCVTDLQEMIDAVYEGNPDHMAYKMVVDYKKTLYKLGYISYKKVGNEWRTYIIKDVDF